MTSPAIVYSCNYAICASVLDNEMCAVVKRGASPLPPDPSCISCRDRQGRSITRRVQRLRVRSTAKRERRMTDKTNELVTQSVRSQMIANRSSLRLKIYVRSTHRYAPEIVNSDATRDYVQFKGEIIRSLKIGIFIFARMA